MDADVPPEVLSTCRRSSGRRSTAVDVESAAGRRVPVDVDVDVPRRCRRRVLVECVMYRGWAGRVPPRGRLVDGLVAVPVDFDVRLKYGLCAVEVDWMSTSGRCAGLSHARVVWSSAREYRRGRCPVKYRSMCVEVDVEVTSGRCAASSTLVVVRSTYLRRAGHVDVPVELPSTSVEVDVAVESGDVPVVVPPS